LNALLLESKYASDLIAFHRYFAVDFYGDEVQGVRSEWREVKGDLGGFCSFSAGRSWDGAEEDFLADGPHLFKERFEFTVLSNGLLEELGLLSR
jgi:hypothetical protein